MPDAEASAAPTALALSWSRLAGRDCLRVSGWSAAARARLSGLGEEELARRLPVFPSAAIRRGDSGRTVSIAGRVPATAGHYFLDGETVCFLPRFPVLGAASFTLLVDPGLVEPVAPVEEVDVADFVPFTIVRQAPVRTSTAAVLAVHPTATVLPRNVLRMYIEFSTTMSEGAAATFVHVRRADTGTNIADALLPFDPELWDGSRRRLTVLFDPGRIKRGLVPHEAAGYPLEEGLEVELVVDAGYPDASGAPMPAGCVQRFRVGPDLRERVDPTRWSLREPPAGTRQPFLVDFDRPLDHALLDRCLSVVDDSGTSVVGHAETREGEGCWALSPADPWQARPHELVVLSILEDVAGNSVARVFDRDLALVEHDPFDADRVLLPFSPRT